MAKKKAKAENLPEAEVTENVDPFIGGEEDDLMDMEYVQDETTESHDTHPPETEEEATLRAQGKDKDIDDPTPPEAEETDDGVQAEEEKSVPEEETEEVVAEEQLEDPRIPKDRFDEVNERMKRAEEKVKQLEQQLDTTIENKKEPEPEPEPYDYVTKDQEAMDALLEGDAKRYSEIQAEIREATRAEAIREAKKLAAEGDNQVRETLTFEETAAQIERDYPAFSEGNEAYNQEAYDELMDLYVGYAQSGRYSRVDALRKASEKAVKIHGLDQSVDPEPAPDNVVSMKKTDVATKAKLAERQPPRMEGGAAGKEEPRVDVNSMSDEQYEALPESTKRRLRGDIL